MNVIHAVPWDREIGGIASLVGNLRSGGVLWDGIGVEDQADIEVRRDCLIERIEKLAKLRGAIATITATDDHPRLDVQRRKERRGAPGERSRGCAFNLAWAHRHISSSG